MWRRFLAVKPWPCSTIRAQGQGQGRGAATEEGYEAADLTRAFQRTHEHRRPEGRQLTPDFLRQAFA